MSRLPRLLTAAAAAMLMLGLAQAPAPAQGVPAQAQAKAQGASTTASCPPSQAPTASEPVGTVGSARPTFKWSPVAGASSYTLYVLRVSDEAIIVREINLTSTSFTPSSDLPTDVDLRWKVKSESPCGAGPYSPSTPLRIETGPGSSVRITSPAAGSTVSGTVNVSATATAASRVEFYVDGALQSTDITAPYEFAWNSGTNPLPAANHPMDFGYYYVEWKDEATFAQRRAEVNPYTNLYYASLSSYASELSQAQYMALLNRSLANAAAEGKKIHLNLELNRPQLSPFLDATLDTAAPYWSHIARVEVADEPDWSRAELQSIIATVEGKRQARGLPRPPQGYGVVYDYRFAVPDSANAAGLDWVGIEAYLDPPGNATSQANVDALTSRVRQRMAEVPAGRKIHLVPMAYDRNGAWTDIETLRDLQTPVYLLAHNDPRVIAINMFSYTRAGGSRDHPELRTSHRLMAEKALGISVPGAALGKRTVSVKAFDAAGNSVADRVPVTVQ